MIAAEFKVRSVKLLD